MTYGCRIRHLRLQALPPTVTGSTTYGCRLRHIWLQALSHMGWRERSRASAAAAVLRRVCSGARGRRGSA
eukprot:scaffold32953_cov64-Phaeocystis_antarctica.AAC.4